MLQELWFDLVRRWEGQSTSKQLYKITAKYLQQQMSKNYSTSLFSSHPENIIHIKSTLILSSLIWNAKSQSRYERGWAENETF